MWRLTLIALLFCSSTLAQPDSSAKERQIEFSAFVYKRSFGLVNWHLSGGVNFPAHKQGWYNNFSLTLTTQDYSSAGGSLLHYTTLTVGKHYELMRKNFFLSAGGNAGLYYSDWAVDGYTAKNYGICIYPRFEIGWNMKKVVLSAGWFYALGFGPYRMYYDGEIVYDDPDIGFFDKFRGVGAASPYVKLILK